MSLQTRLDSLITALGADFKLGTRPFTFYASGALSVRTGKSFVPLLGSGKIIAVKGWLNTPGTGATTFKIDVNLNGTTIFGTQANRPIWAASSNTPVVG